jgi:hypothetical protein
VSEHTGLYQYRYKLHNGEWCDYITFEDREARDASVLHYSSHNPEKPVQERDFVLVAVSGELHQGDLFSPGDDARWDVWPPDANYTVADEVADSAYWLRLASKGWSSRLKRCAAHIEELTAAAERVLLAQNRTTLDALTAALVPFRAKEIVHD